VVEVLARDGTIPQVSPSPEEMKDFVAGETARWGKIIKGAGLAGTE